MSTKNKNKKSVSEALLEMDKLSQNLKESSEATLSSLLSEAVKKYMTEAIEDAEEDEDEKEYSIEDDTTEDETNDDEFSSEDAEETESEEETEEAPEEGEDDEWSEFEDFKVDDETYDLTTGENGDETLTKVYKLLKDTDQVVVKKDGDTVSLKDNETGAEYVIELGGDEPAEDENEFEFEFESESDNNDLEDETMKESKEMVYEIDLGYTNNYQEKDPIQGLSNAETSKSGKTWDKVPTGTEKPWAGDAQSKGEPFEENVNEDVDLSDTTAQDLQNAGVEQLPEATNVTLPNRRKKVKSHSMQQKDYPKAAHHDSKNAEYKALEEKVQMLQKENKEMKAMIPQIKKAMNESVLVNVKLGRIVKLLSENATTRKEKVDIINRFNEEANTINEAKALYESIKRELNSGVKANAESLLEGKTIATADKTTVNETTVYQSNEIKEMLDFMKRMNKC